MEDRGYAPPFSKLHVSLLISSVSTVNRNSFGFSADVLYDFGTGLELLSPLCPHLFLELAGLGNFAKVYISSSSSFLIMQNALNLFVQIQRGLK